VKPWMRTTITGGLLAAALGVAADQAAASYTAQVQNAVLKITGDGASDRLALRQGLLNTLDLDVGDDGTADLSFDRTTFTAIDVDAGGGDDYVRAESTLGQLAQPLTINGGAGADTLYGGPGPETLLGSSGNDTVDGSFGSDVVRLGTGNDVFNWKPGDTSDTVDGEAGTDRVDFHGSVIGEALELAANGPRVRLSRNIASVTLDLGGIERVAFDPRSGPDTVVVNDLRGTELTRTDVNLLGTGDVGDAQADAVIVRGTDTDDTLAATPDGGVAGLGGEVHATGGEPGLDHVDIQTLGGADTITGGIALANPIDLNADGGEGPDTVRFAGTAGDDALIVAPIGTELRVAGATATGGLDSVAVEDVRLEGLGGTDTLTAVGQAPPSAQVTFDGGAGNDTLQGSGGGDAMLGGSGNDVVDGNRGADAVLLGSGNDTFAWDPGDGNDSVEGEAGSDRVDFDASNAGESIDVAASGDRVRLFRNIASVTTDFDGVEALGVRLFGGADTMTVNNVTGTDLATVDVDLNSSIGGGDGSADTVITNGTDEADSVLVRRSGSQPAVRGLGAETRIAGSEVTLDTLRIQTLGGDDAVTVGDIWDLIAPVVDLGANE
jgi:Ca2+-binding RTX toxin-like protein